MDCLIVLSSESAASRPSCYKCVYSFLSGGDVQAAPWVKNNWWTAPSTLYSPFSSSLPLHHRLGEALFPHGTPPPPLANFWSAAPSIINSYVLQHRCWRLLLIIWFLPSVTSPALPRPHPMLAAGTGCTTRTTLADVTVATRKQRDKTV